MNHSTKHLKKEDMEETVVTVTDLSRGGSAVARDEQNRVVFIPFAAPGDRIRVRILSREKNYAHAEIVEILEFSKDRVTPPCPVFGRCGGCEWQHLPYDFQFAKKASGVLHALKRVGAKIPPKVEHFPAERIWNYRNRVQLRGFQDQIGFYGRGSQELVTIDECFIARPEINAVLASVREEGKSKPLPYKVEVEVSEQGTIQKAWNDAHAAMGFRQVHDEQNEKLKNYVATLIPDGVRLFDLFGGFGNLSLGVASRVFSVDCVDVSVPREAPLAANYRYHRSEVFHFLKNTARNPQMRGRSVIKAPPIWAIFDPPREGLGDVSRGIVSHVQKIGISGIIAVGCDPDSWAKDVRNWEKAGYQLDQIAIFDLFPQTHHVEAIGLLSSLTL